MATTATRQRSAMTSEPSLRDMMLGRDGGLLAPGEQSPAGKSPAGKSPVDRSRRNSTSVFRSIKRPSIQDGVIDAVQTEISCLEKTTVSTHRSKPKKDSLAFFRKAFVCFKKVPAQKSEGDPRAVTLEPTLGYGAVEVEIIDPPKRGPTRGRVMLPKNG